MDFNLNSRAKGVMSPTYAHIGTNKSSNKKNSISESGSTSGSSLVNVTDLSLIHAGDVSDAISDKNVASSDFSEQNNSALNNNLENEQAAREKQEEAERIAREKLERAKEALDVISHGQIALRFEESKDFEGSQVVNVVDVESNEVIRQIPSDEFLKVSDIIEKFSDAREARKEASKGFNPYRMSSYQQSTQDKSLSEDKHAQDVDVAQLQQDHRGAFLDFEA